MITLTFGQRGDMRGAAFTSPSLDSQLGTVTGIVSNNRTTVTTGTSKGGSVVLAGRFKFSNQNSLQNSDVTGVTLSNGGKQMLLKLSGAPTVDFEDIARQETPQLMVALLMRSAGQGIVVQGSAFADVLIGFGGVDKLFGNAGDDVLRGGLGNDQLTGGGGVDRLDGGVGHDVMTGGKGNDNYVVDAAGDKVVEVATGGSDSVTSSVTWAMGAYVEKLTLVGSKSIHGTGNASDNHLIGNSAANTLRGAAGDDRLDGGRGADRMEGGRGDDVYIVDNGADKVIERASEGTDTVHSTIDYSLPTNVERLTLLGSADIKGTGNALANVLRGNGGDNVLSGREGDDDLLGGSGNDVLSGDAGNDDLLGGSGNDVLSGDAGNDDLSGGAGNDVLLPGHGHDSLSGGSGADDFVVTGGRGDSLVISDFDVLEGDHLWLMDSAVPDLDNGPLAAANLRAIADTPSGNDDYLVYDQASGILFYDATGNGGPLSALVSLGENTILLAGDINIGPLPV